MKIAIACDHGALELKEALIPFLRSLGHSVRDFGTHSLASCDYPDYAIAAAEAVAEGSCDKGIVLCTTGIGVSIAANKVHGIRCALLSDVNSARMTRLHNDTNMMAMGAAVVNQDLACSIVETWLSTPFSNEDRHQRRIDKIMECEHSEKKKQKRKTRNKKRRIRSFNPITKVINLGLCILLILSLLLIPIADFITNLTDPTQLVTAIFESGLLDDFLGGAQTPEASDPAVNPEDVPNPDASDDTDNPDAGGSGSSTSGTATAEESGGLALPEGMDISALLGNMGELAGVLDTNALLENLDIPEGTTVDTAVLVEDLKATGVAQELVTAYTSDLFNSAMGLESTFNEDTIKEILENNKTELADAINKQLPEESQINADDMMTAVNSVLDVALPTVMENLPSAGDTVAMLAESNPIIGIILKALKFIRTEALRAVVLLLTLALCIVIAIFRFPGFRGLTSIGFSALVAALLCGGVMLALEMPIFTDLIANIEIFGAILMPMLNGLHNAFKTCAVVYAVLGGCLVVCSTILRGVISRIIDAIFSFD